MQVSDRLCAASKAVEDCVNRELALSAMARNLKENGGQQNEAVLFWLREERRVATKKTIDAVIAWKTVRDETVTTP
jgi:hypothetical protein